MKFLLLFFFCISSYAHSNELIKSLTNGQCTTSDCLRIYNIKSLTNGQCTTSDCLNKSITSIRNKSGIIPNQIRESRSKMHKDDNGRWVNSKGGNIYGDSRFNLDADPRFNLDADPRFNLDADPRFNLDADPRFNLDADPRFNPDGIKKYE